MIDTPKGKIVKGAPKLNEGPGLSLSEKEAACLRKAIDLFNKMTEEYELKSAMFGRGNFADEYGHGLVLLKDVALKKYDECVSKPDLSR